LQKTNKTEYEEGKEEDRIDFFNINKPSAETFIDALKDAIKNIDNAPYILHFFGHSQMKDNKAYIAFMDDSEHVQWVSSEDFASYFNDIPLLPEMIVLQACESGQISSEGTGLAIDLVKQGIPAVVGMQNEVTEDVSLTFIDRFYDGVLKGLDIAEAVTRARTYLGCEYKKTPNLKDQYYCDNSFGTPVIFTSTPTPIRLMSKVAAPDTITAIRKMKCPRCGKIYENPRIEVCGWVACRSTPLQPYREEVVATIESSNRSNQPAGSSIDQLLSSITDNAQSGN
jgi:hypothetical protein